MHICFLNMPIEYYSPISGGAVATVIMQTGRCLLQRDHSVSVLTLLDGNETYPVGKVIPLNVKGRGDLIRPLRYWSAIRRRWECWDWPAYEYYLASYSSALAQLRPAPDAVIVFNDLVSSKYIRRVLPDAKVLVWLQNENRTAHDSTVTDRYTQAFIACSEYIREWSSLEFGIPKDRFRVSHNAADPEVFFPSVDYLENRPEVRVLFVGRIDRNKGPDLVADAVCTLRNEGLPVRLTVAGGLWFYGHGNEMKDPYFRLLRDKMEAAQADYLGHIDRYKVPDLYKRHDVTCILSRSQDPYPLVTIEAMASGNAVIASRRGGLPEACSGAGLLVEPDDFPSVVNALRSLVVDRTRLREEKEKSVVRAARSPWSTCADAVEEVLG